MKKSPLFSCGFVALCFFLPELFDLDARPGGGSSYSGGGGGSSGGGGGGEGGELVFLAVRLLIWLIIEYPAVGIPLTIVAGIAFFRHMKNSPRNAISTLAPSNRRSAAASALESDIEGYKAKDTNFSRILFLDFAQVLYHQFHTHRSRKEFRNLAPFLKPDLLHETMAQSRSLDVTEIVIGSANIVQFYTRQDSDFIVVQLDANYTETRRTGSGKEARIRFFTVERWSFRRKSGVLSREPAEMREVRCPSCGAGLNVDDFGRCNFCASEAKPGEKHWQLASRVVLHQEALSDGKVFQYAEERGTNLPTVKSPLLSQASASFAQAHGIEDWDAYVRTWSEKVATPLFHTVYGSWSSRKWEAARPVLTDHLFQSHNYWIEEYIRHKATNRLEDIRISRIELAKIEMDRFFEAFTARVHASLLDYVVNESGKVIAGDAKSPRVFSEYWTLVRRTGVDKLLDSCDPTHCPSCGAATDKVGMAGVCEYCDTKITTGDFGWVLAQITQDEAYRG